MKRLSLRLGVILFMLVFLILLTIVTAGLLVLFILLIPIAIFTEKPLFWFQKVFNGLSTIKINKDGKD